MKEQNVETDCLAIQRFNCLYDREDVDNWKEWLLKVQKPMNYVLASSLITAGVLSTICLIILNAQLQNVDQTMVQTYKKYQLEVFFMELLSMVVMFGILVLGNYLIERRFPRPKLERCLEVHYYKNSFSLFYYYKMGRKKVYIDNFTYQLLEFIKLENNIILINGRKFQLGNAEVKNFLSPTEHCRYGRYYGYVRGIYRFPYETDVKKLIDQVYAFKEGRTNR